MFRLQCLAFSFLSPCFAASSRNFSQPRSHRGLWVKQCKVEIQKKLNLNLKVDELMYFFLLPARYVMFPLLLKKPSNQNQKLIRTCSTPYEFLPKLNSVSRGLINKVSYLPIDYR